MFPRIAAWFGAFGAWTFAFAAPHLLDGQFDLPPGFHIYRAAGPELSGGSYAMTFDGDGRLLIGDGNAVRRLIDKDSDGVFDAFEVIATGLGWRGPQGLLVYGDKLFAVGGDGIQLFEGYGTTTALVHKGRIGAKLSTGGDHEAHTLLRGHDGYIYFMAGNGSGITNRAHITEETSPRLVEREASVFRISPDGRQWECVSSGGRNPPSLGMNYLGELFSLDSDMEWHVGLPWYRPVRLNHWVMGGDQGWQDVGAYPPYYIDNAPGILDVGRGSPNWGTFYEHTQFPEKYQNAFVVCDYRWKRESNDQYATTGRLVVFFLTRLGAGWTATMEPLARPKPNARDANGKPISFALVDVQVAPDGSLFVSDHNQGVWRIFYDTNETSSAVQAPPIVPPWPEWSNDPLVHVQEILRLPQPGSEHTRLREQAIRGRIGAEFLERHLMDVAASPKGTWRYRAIHLLAPGFNELPHEFLSTLARDSEPEIPGFAAWLLGLRARPDEVPELISLLTHEQDFVRRRAAEAFTRMHARDANTALIERLDDRGRLVRYVAMNALAQRPTTQWFDNAVKNGRPQGLMRALVAAHVRRELPADTRIRDVIRHLVSSTKLGQLNTEDRLDLLRVLALFQNEIAGDATLQTQIAMFISREFPDANRNLRWEQARLIGQFRVNEAFSRLLTELETEREHVTQFHFAQSIAKLTSGWSESEEQRLLRWFFGTQRGWFAEYDAKGVEFPQFWATVLDEFGRHHTGALLKQAGAVDLSGEVGGVLIGLIAKAPEAEDRLLGLYRGNPAIGARVRVARAFRAVRGERVATLIREELGSTTNVLLRGALLNSLSAQAIKSTDAPLFARGLREAESAVVRSCVSALARLKPAVDEALARALLEPLSARRDLFHPLQDALVALTGDSPPQYSPQREGRPERVLWENGKEFWFDWYAARFGRRYELGNLPPEKPDQEIHEFLVSDVVRGGNAQRGARVYESLQCHTCHGGGVAPGREGRIFGPDLAGVTRRLTRTELADALVYPSKQVPDRFKAFTVETRAGETLSGFITEQSETHVTLVDREQVHRLARKEIRSLAPQASSLMPSGVLNRLSADELRDLMAFLDGAAMPTKP